MGAATVARAERVGLQGQRTRHGLDHHHISLVGAHGDKLPVTTAKHFSIKVTFGESEGNADAGRGWQGDFSSLGSQCSRHPSTLLAESRQCVVGGDRGQRINPPM